jgi:hypothetical protein
MSSALYDKGREAFLTAGINLSSATIKAMLLRTTGGGGTPYTPDLAADQYLDDIPNNAYARAAAAETLGSKTVTDGVFDAADTVFSGVSAGDPIQAIVIYKDTGTESTSPLIAYIDTITGFPFTPTGGDINVSWSNGSSRIFKL